MLLALGATSIVIVALLGEVCWPYLKETGERVRARRRRIPATAEYDPGRERRAEQRARQLLRSCVNDEEWEMYRDLGFIRVWGGLGAATAVGGDDDADGRDPDELLWFESPDDEEPRAQPPDAPGHSGAPYAYLIYPHKPIVCFLAQTRRLLNEYCVEFPDETRPYGSSRLPDSDDVLAKWMALTGDERRLIGSANMHLPGRQVDPRQIRRDLWRLSEWERARMSRERRAAGEPAQ